MEYLRSVMRDMDGWKKNIFGACRLMNETEINKCIIQLLGLIKNQSRTIHYYVSKLPVLELYCKSNNFSILSWLMLELRGWVI
jgi:hypothetical protein